MKTWTLDLLKTWVGQYIHVYLLFKFFVTANSYKFVIFRALSTSSDVIIVQTEDHSFISKIADGANVPTVAWRSEMYATFQALADTLTVYEHFNILSPLTLSWVGPSTALFNSYLFIMPRMKINLRYCCYDSNVSGIC